MACSTQPVDLQWQEEDGYRWAELKPGETQKTGFKQQDSWDTGIDFENTLTQKDIDENQNFMNGSGVAAADVDGDGWVDLYFGRLKGSNKLYKNMGGFRFKDITEEAGVAHPNIHTTGVVFVDVDGDGDDDLLVASLDGKNALYINDGKGRFRLDEASGLERGKGSTMMTLSDIDQDGDLDLYIANNKNKSVKDIFEAHQLTTSNIVKPGEMEGRYILREPYDKYYIILYREHEPPILKQLGEINELYINNGDGKFTKVDSPAERFFEENGEPSELLPEWSLTARFQDINGDMLPDLYICNDFWTPDRIWINQGNGRFKSLGKLVIRNFSFSSMGVAISDINRDGTNDIFVTEMLSASHRRRARQIISLESYPAKVATIDYQPQYMRNSLYLGRGDSTFAEIAYYSGVEASEWSWATRFLDVDLDGYEDLIVNTGFVYDAMDIDYQKRVGDQIDRSQGRVKSYIKLADAPPLKLTNKIFRNNRDLTFTDKSEEWGFTEPDISYGLATADFDNDGDLDLAVSRLMEEAVLYENITSSPRIAVRLIGNSPNTRGIGAKIKLKVGGEVQEKEMVSGGDYMSGSEPLVVFAAGTMNKNSKLTVTWPGGKQSVIDSIGTNRIYEIFERTASKHNESSQNKIDGTTPSYFKDLSERINHQHREAYFDDFKKQPLLPIKLSRLGPGVSWIDFDADGDEDLVLGNGKGEKMGLYENLGEGRFTRRTILGLSNKAPGDQTTILGWAEGHRTRIVVGNAGYEQGNKNAPSAYAYTMEAGQVIRQDSIPGIYSTAGALAASDYDGDGDLDLFIGGRFVPSNYPADANSKLFKNTGDSFIPDEENADKFNKLGMVTGALFTDYNLDGYQDLLLSTEWGSLKLFRNKGSSFQEVTAQTGLNRYKGWWNGVTTGDVNNDGKPDIIATNIGLNSAYQMDSKHPLKIFYDDFDRDGKNDIVEAFYEPEMEAYVPRRRLYEFEAFRTTILSNLMTHRQYANATLREILDRNLDTIPSKEINTLQHMVFINTGSGFAAHPLPTESQFSTGFHPGIGDFDNDGNEDIFISQNFFAFPLETPRIDAGLGLWLKGDGRGNFTAVPGDKSGIKVYGEQRGAALGDFNSDGKVDLVITQNDTTARLFVNQTQRRGLRVRLNGRLGNEQGFGSSLRLVYADGTKGSRREIRAGSGYWSQESAIQVLGVKQGSDPSELKIRWYDGTQQNIKIVNSKWDYTVYHPSSTP